MLTLYTIPYHGQSRSSSDKVIAAPHTKDAASDDRIANVIYTGTSRIGEHGERTDELREEDDTYGLTCSKTNAYHRRPERPIAEA